MRLTKVSTSALLAVWIIITIFYYNTDIKLNISKRSHFSNYSIQKLPYSQSDEFSGTTHFTIGEERYEDLINTNGCVIPDIRKTMIFKEAKIVKGNCGVRAIFIHKVSDDTIMFIVDAKKMRTYKKSKPYKCCYQFISRPTSKKPGIQDTKIIYSKCKQFRNGTKRTLKEEVVKVTCGVNPVTMRKIFYEDVYIIVKKIQNIKKKGDKQWNVLILGIDTMSRTRAYASMPKAINLLQKKWLVGYNTFPNLAALLAGYINIYGPCKPSMDHCNDLLIWSKYKNADYVTAFGEDYLSLPDTYRNYGGFEIPPTDHYLRPLFLSGETYAGNVVCTKKLPSAQHMLEYAYNFSQTYKDENYFGMFWINSCSHSTINAPALCDPYIKHFFQNLHSSANTLNNTFIIFMSDHGIRYGETRYQMEGYYEERLPMLFMWVPHEFRKRFPTKYANLHVNQRRLTATYDLHATLWEILKMSKESLTIVKPAACPQCESLFEEKAGNRTCADAAIDQKWCSCYRMHFIELTDTDGWLSLKFAVSFINNRMKNVETIKCTKCITLKLKTVLRIHSYYDSTTRSTYYVVAFLMSPGNVGYEFTIEKNKTGLKVVDPISSITFYNKRGNCVRNKLSDRPYCVCENIPKCK